MAVYLFFELFIYLIRFHSESQEPKIGRDIVPPVDDDIQLTVDEYRQNLYEVVLYLVRIKSSLVLIDNSSYNH